MFGKKNSWKSDHSSWDVWVWNKASNSGSQILVVFFFPDMDSLWHLAAETRFPSQFAIECSQLRWWDFLSYWRALRKLFRQWNILLFSAASIGKPGTLDSNHGNQSLGLHYLATSLYCSHGPIIREEWGMWIVFLEIISRRILLEAKGNYIVSLKLMFKWRWDQSGPSFLSTKVESKGVLSLWQQSL